MADMTIRNEWTIEVPKPPEQQRRRVVVQCLSNGVGWCGDDIPDDFDWPHIVALIPPQYLPTPPQAQEPVPTPSAGAAIVGWVREGMTAANGVGEILFGCESIGQFKVPLCGWPGEGEDARDKRIAELEEKLKAACPGPFSLRLMLERKGIALPPDQGPTPAIEALLDEKDQRLSTLEREVVQIRQAHELACATATKFAGECDAARAELAERTKERGEYRKIVLDTHVALGARVNETTEIGYLRPLAENAGTMVSRLKGRLASLQPVVEAAQAVADEPWGSLESCRAINKLRDQIKVSAIVASERKDPQGADEVRKILLRAVCDQRIVKAALHYEHMRCRGSVANELAARNALCDQIRHHMDEFLDNAEAPLPHPAPDAARDIDSLERIAASLYAARDAWACRCGCECSHCDRLVPKLRDIHARLLRLASLPTAPAPDAGEVADEKWLTVIVREGAPEVLEWDAYMDGVGYWDDASAQWSEAWVCKVVRPTAQERSEAQQRRCAARACAPEPTPPARESDIGGHTVPVAHPAVEMAREALKREHPPAASEQERGCGVRREALADLSGKENE